MEENFNIPSEPVMEDPNAFMEAPELFVMPFAGNNDTNQRSQCKNSQGNINFGNSENGGHTGGCHGGNSMNNGNKGKSIDD
ncbi:MAG: hypothetical protein Q4C49_03265 [Bacillota bacterium]|nr:hypothetical protein [Bacillota bacterium]